MTDIQSCPDVVPPPFAYPPTSTSVWPDDNQRNAAHRMLENLNLEAGNAERASERLQRTVQDLQHLLNPDSLTTYKFNKSSLSHPTRMVAPPTQAASQAPLGGFARLVLDSTNVHYRYSAPDSSIADLPDSAHSSAPAQAPARSSISTGTGALNVPANMSASASISARPPSITARPMPRTDSRIQDTHIQQTPAGEPSSSSTSTPGRIEVRIGPSHASIPSAATVGPRATTSQNSQNGTAFAQNAAAHKVVLQPGYRQQSNVAVVVPRPPPPNPIAVSQKQSQVVRQEQKPANHDRSVNSQGFAPSSQGPPRSSQADVQVIIPRTKPPPGQTDRNPYPEIARPHTNGVPKPKPRDIEVEQQLAAAAIDQREKAHAAVTKFQGMLSDIFEAEDHLQPDTSGAQSHTAARFFIVEDGADIERPLLLPEVQTKLDVVLQKVVSAGQLQSIQVEYLSRAMKLCENAITASSSVDFSITQDTSQELDDWANRTGLGEQGLYACRSLLRIMTAGREEKQLYSEDVLRSLLNLTSHAAETLIIPIVELRSDAGEAFRIASTQHKVLFPFVAAYTRVLRLLGDLLFKTDVDESTLSTAEYICKTLVFVENATTDKEAALGVQKFETVRRAAMDVLAKIFARYTEQRQFIFDEILTSLEKLPVGRQSARQFKMADAKPIQLVSALLMRLVQTSATRPQARERNMSSKTEDTQNGTGESDEDAERDADGESDDEDNTSNTKRSRKLKSSEEEEDLKTLATPLYDAAIKDASYVVNYLLHRAMSSTKTGDQPYRNLLDIFTEDFLGVLGTTDWPAAELLLRALLAKLLDIGKSNKSSAPAKSMALELMGSMATRIIELRLQAQHAAKHAGSDESHITSKLIDIYEASVNDDLTDADLVAFDGPYRVTLEYLQLRDNNDPQLQTARGYLIMQWSRQLLQIENSTATMQEMAVRLAKMVKDFHWLENECDFPRVSTEEGKFASALFTLQMPFCQAFNSIFTKLLNSMGSDQASLRSKSLKSIEQLLEMDPAILDRSAFVLHNIIKCLGDSSTQVRDSALGLISKCLTLRPRLDADVYERVIQRSGDANVHVRKRAMKMLKDIYLRSGSLTPKSRISNALVSRIADTDDTVTELARQTLEEVWMVPFHPTCQSDRGNIKAKLQLKEQTSLVVNMTNDKTESADVLTELLQSLLSPGKSKAADANFKVCSQMVKIMFDAIIDSSELPGSPLQSSVLHTLTVFAAANATLFTSDQLQTLQPYVQNLTNDDSLPVYRCAIVILRYTLPHMKSLNKDFLGRLQQALIASFQKLPKAELKEVASCLWMLNGELGNTERLVKITVSVLFGIKQSRNISAADEKAVAKVRRLIAIAGIFVRAFDLDGHIQFFTERFPEFKGDSVAALSIDNICPFTSPKQHPEIREAALESLCLICQAWPKQFMRSDVCNALELAFQSDNKQLEFILVLGLKNFFASGDKPSEANPDIPLGAGIAAGQERLGKTYVATDRDGAATSIAQRFLHSILKAAIGSADELALTAAQVVASINRQGLVHPKESGPCFVALETCPDNKIANVAFQEHRTLYHKHESMFEKEHMRSIQQAFDYQHDVIRNTLGFVGTPPVAKLHMFWEVLKTGTAKARKKFLSSICTKMNFEPSKLEISGDLPAHVDMTRFIVENLAFFDYNKLDELQHLVAALEKVVSDTGTGVSHAIELEMLRLRIAEDQSIPDAKPLLENGMAIDLPQLAKPAIPSVPFIDPARLRQLTVFVQILLLLWDLRTYLRRLWNLSRPSGVRGRPSAVGKDSTAARAPQRIPNFTNLTERYIARNAEIVAALKSEDEMRKLCAGFAELMAVDNELKVADGDEDVSMTAMDSMLEVRADNGGGYETPSEGSVRSPSAGPGSASQQGKRGKKRKSFDGGSNANTPRKKGKQRKSGLLGTPRRKSKSGGELDDENWD